MTLDPALNVPCPTCFVKAGEPCRSRHAISVHQGRREALADLGSQANELLSPKPQRKPERQKTANRAGPPVPVFVGKTGKPVAAEPEDEDRPPWE